MQIKLIHTQDYLLLVDEEAEIKEGNLVYRVDSKDAFKADDLLIHLIERKSTEHCYLILSYYPLTKEAKELDLPLLPNPFEENNIEELALNKFMFPSDLFEKMKKSSQNYYLLEEEFGSDNLNKYREVLGFIEGYKAAQSKQFNLESILPFRKILEEGALTNMSCASAIVEFDRFIQSLSTQQYPKEFIVEYETKIIKYVPYPEEIKIKGQDWEKGYPVTEKVLKTITNSEGKEVVIGKYIY